MKNRRRTSAWVHYFVFTKVGWAPATPRRDREDGASARENRRFNGRDSGCDRNYLSEGVFSPVTFRGVCRIAWVQNGHYSAITANSPRKSGSSPFAIPGVAKPGLRFSRPWRSRHSDSRRIMVFMDPNSLLRPSVNQAASTIWLFALVTVFLFVARLALRSVARSPRIKRGYSLRRGR